MNLPISRSEKRLLWASLVGGLRDRISFAQIDLIPDDAQLAAMKAAAEVHAAFRALSLAAQENRGVAVPPSSGPAPLGMHIELAAPDTFKAFEVYGPYSINVDVWRESDRALLAGNGNPARRPDPLIDQIDSMDALLLSLDETELSVASAWAARSGVRIELCRR